MRRLTIPFVVVLIILVAYFAGPHPKTPVYNTNLPALPPTANALQQFVADGEKTHRLKPGNNAEIIWNDSLHHKTKYALVYLHGFSASHEEGKPIHEHIAKKFGCNLYLSRLTQHGIDTTEPLINLTADNLWESAKLAYAIGKQLGDSVIIMGTSTGGSLALQLAATYPDIAGLVLMSPNIEINDANAWLLNNPWGLQIARTVVGSNYNTAKNNTPIYKQYWTYKYRMEAAVQLQEYLETAMTEETFKKVKQPVLTLYYYKDEQHQDPVVKVSAIKQMFNELGTPAGNKKEMAVPGTKNHVMGSYILSKDLLSVEKAVTDFLGNIIK